MPDRPPRAGAESPSQAEPRLTADARVVVARLAIAIVVMIIAALGSLVATRRPGDGHRTPELPTIRLDWRRAEVPNVRVMTIAPYGDGLLVGAQGVDRQAKAQVVHVGTDGETVSVPLLARSTYAAGTRWRSIATHGTDIVAIGGMAGGAHSITRWTIWRGDATRLTEFPQSAETFGGSHSGGLSAVAFADGRPVVVGAWDGTGGRLDIAVWGQEPAGQWVRRSSAGTALESTSGTQSQVAGAAASQSGVLLLGSSVHLDEAEVRQTAEVWQSHDAGWTTWTLPASHSSASAGAATCEGSECWVTGQDGQVLALWQLQNGSASRVGLPFPTTATTAPPSVRNHRVYLALPGRGIVVRDGQGRWSRIEAPGHAAVRQVVVTGSTVFASCSSASGDAVWYARLR